MPPKRKAPAPPPSVSSRGGSRARVCDVENQAVVAASKDDSMTTTMDDDGVVPTSGTSAAAMAAAVAAAAADAAPRDALAELSIRVEELSGAFGRLAQRGGDANTLRSASETEAAALREKAKAQETLISTLRNEISRLDARLTAEGGPDRLPPAMIRASSLFMESEARAASATGAAAKQEARAVAAEARADAAVFAAGLAAAEVLSAQTKLVTAQHSSDSLSASAQTPLVTLSVLRSLTGLDVSGDASAYVNADGMPCGTFECRLSGAGKSGGCAFRLDFFLGISDSGNNVPMIEYTPGKGVESALPAYLHDVITFDAVDAPGFFGRVVDACGGESVSAQVAVVAKGEGEGESESEKEEGQGQDEDQDTEDQGEEETLDETMKTAAAAASSSSPPETAALTPETAALTPETAALRESLQVIEKELGSRTAATPTPHAVRVRQALNSRGSSSSTKATPAHMSSLLRAPQSSAVKM